MTVYVIGVIILFAVLFLAAMICLARRASGKDAGIEGNAPEHKNLDSTRAVGTANPNRTHPSGAAARWRD